MAGREETLLVSSGFSCAFIGRSPGAARFCRPGLLVGTLALLASTVPAADIVRDGRALGAIWLRAPDPVAAPEAKSAPKPTEDEAARDLVTFIQQMTGVKLDVRQVAGNEKPPAGEPAIVLGQLALDMGLAVPPKTPSLDGYRIQSRKNHLLLAGESPVSTRFAVTHFLETLGCRWFMDAKVGEIIPATNAIPLGGLEVSEKPDFLDRRVWFFVGPRQRTGTYAVEARHDWEHVPAKTYFADHPEYFAEHGGKRKAGGWVCTSHPDVAKLFAEAYVARATKGTLVDTISPPDGQGFCECAACKALDTPGYIEPSSGRVCVSDRYLRFFSNVAGLVKPRAPNLLLCFYAYSDYTLPPKQPHDIPDNLCASVATIRFCRLHSINNPLCESRQRYKEVIEGWGHTMRIASRDYNYNLAELTVPISKISVFRDEFPFLKRLGCIGINLESFQAYCLYGPHTYLATRLMWKADADVNAILDDYYAKLCGPAAPYIKSYWERIDRACREAEVHCGSFYGLHVIWTPTLVAACQADLDAAAKAGGSEREREAVHVFQLGLDSAKHFLAVREAVNRCDFAGAQAALTKWIAHLDDIAERGYFPRKEYRRGYVERFLKPMIDDGAACSTGGCQLVAQLPDTWDFRYDPANEGETNGWHRVDAAPDGWQKVRTYSATLDEQKVPEQLTWMWYRTTLRVPAPLPGGPLHLWFGEVDGSPTTVFINGECVGDFTGGRKPGDVLITGKLQAGKDNLIAVRTCHKGISELKLGGILRPIMVYAGEKPKTAAKDLPANLFGK